MSNSRSSSRATTPEQVDKAAETIQRNFRGFKDRLKAREKAAFNISQLIEYSEEQDHLNLNKFFSRWIKMIKNSNNDEISRYISNSLQDSLIQLTENDIKIEPEYAGIHLSEDFNEVDFENLLISFKNNQTLHTRYAIMILNRAIDHLKKLRNINEINCFESATTNDANNRNTFDDEGVKVTVVGDLHGQFIDLFTIFDLNGLPSKQNIYLFNGDFVDRGPQQCEVYLTLMYACVLYKDYVNLNRGNHEDYGCSVRFGLKEEIMNKYCLYSNMIMKKFAQSFTHLPIASIISQQSINNNVNKILVGNIKYLI